MVQFSTGVRQPAARRIALPWTEPHPFRQHNFRAAPANMPFLVVHLWHMVARLMHTCWHSRSPEADDVTQALRLDAQVELVLVRHKRLHDEGVHAACAAVHPHLRQCIFIL